MMHTRRHPLRQHQQGMTLAVGMIMLIMISLAAVASYQISRVSMEVVGNMQFQGEAVASADRTIQEVLSTSRFHENPTNALPNPCGANNTKCYDFNDDGIDDVTVVLQTPSCVKVRVKPNAELNLNTLNADNQPLDGGCASQAVLNGIESNNSGESLCTDTIWDLSMVATGIQINTSVTVTQGVSVTILTTDADTFCI